MNNDEVMNDINTMLEKAEPLITADCCIYRVPFQISKFNQDAYTPQVVSIGPLHHNNKRLQNMKRLKLVYCKHFIDRAEVSKDSLIRRIEELEPKVRRCYYDTLDLCKKDLVKVILVDSGFIFELFYRSFNNKWSEDDAFLFKPWFLNSIKFDLLLLENQLPFFVLESLFNLAFESETSSRINLFLEFTFVYFANFKKYDTNINAIRSIGHFTDLLRTFYLEPLEERLLRKNENMILTRSAIELVEAGVRFNVNTDAKCLLELRSSGRGRVLEIPLLQVDDGTETLFRNLMALEQCHYPTESYFMDYVIFLDFLINTNRDVDTLVRKGILVHTLDNSDSVVNLFNGLAKNITVGNFSSNYLSLCQDLDAFCGNPWNKWKASLRRDYGNTPWQAAASIAGVVLLILSFVQSVCSVIQVVMQ